MALCLLFAAPVLYLSFAGASLRAPDWLAAKLEEEMNTRAAGGASFAFSEVDLIIDTRLRPKVQMRNLTIFDQNGTSIGVLDNVSAGLSLQQVFRGAASLRALDVSGAIITVRRARNGEFDLMFGQGARTQGDLAAVLDAIDLAFVQGPLAALGSVTADNLTLSLEDARSGQIWRVTDGRIRLDHLPDQISLRIDALVFNGTEELASTEIRFETQKGSSRATLTANFENALAADIAAQSPVLGFLSVLEAPISGALRSTIDESGAIEDLAGTLSLGAGALKPTPDAPPIAFDSGQAYLDYDPAAQSIALSRLAFRSETATLTAEGTALLRDFQGRWPSTLVGQFEMRDVALRPKGVFAEAMRFDRGAFDFRMRLDPFSVDIGQVSLGPADQRVLARGRAELVDAGWLGALDLSLNRISPERVLELWPVAFARGTRDWIRDNVKGGHVHDLAAALRFAPGVGPKVSLSFQFDEATMTPVGFLPPVTGASGYASLDGRVFAAVMEAGRVAAPSGGRVDVGGTVFRVPNLGDAVERAEVELRAAAPLEAALSLLNLPPLGVMDDAGIDVDVGKGRAVARAELGFEMKETLSVQDVAFTAEGAIRGVRSTSLIPGRSLVSERLDFTVDGRSVTIGGEATLDGLPVNGTWRKPIGPGASDRSEMTGLIELSDRFLDTFGIGLPPGTLSGSGVGQIDLALERGAAPRFTLRSDLNRVAMSLPMLDWSKAQNARGELVVAGALGPVPRIETLRLQAPGLSLAGDVELNAGGGLARARFDRVRVGDWLDAPVTLRGRGNAPPGVEVTGGVIDLRQAAFGASGSGRGEGGGSDSGPLSLRLDQLTISEGIVLRSFRGDFQPGRGLSGQFSGALNGTAPLQGSVIDTPAGPAVRIRSDSAGQALAAMGLVRNSQGGQMDLTLNPTGGRGVYDGRLKIVDMVITRAPALTELFNAISIVGLIDQLNSGGIRLSDTEAEFRLSPQQVTLYYASAVGPSIGVSLDGIYDLVAERLDMQGVISPVYFLNGIGQLVSRGRDGLFGFNFRLTGAAEDPRVSVNPLSILTPGGFREIFRRPPPTRSQ